jgi:hypothetical protein
MATQEQLFEVEKRQDRGVEIENALIFSERPEIKFLETEEERGGGRGGRGGGERERRRRK